MTAEPVYVINDAVSYEWVCFEVYRHPRQDDRYATFWDSGCSCDEYEPPTDDDIDAAEPLSRAEVRNDMNNFLNRYGSFINPGDAVRHREDFETDMDAAA